VALPDGNPAPATVGLPVLGYGVINGTYQEVAGFGDLMLNFTDAFSVSGGLRYSHFRLETDQTLSGIFLSSASQSGANSDSKVTYSLNPVLKVTRDVMIYGRIASGYRPGGPNVATNNPASYKPDTAVSYEVGSKGEVLGRTLTYDVSAFLIDWDDIQIQQTQAGANGGPPINFVGNVGRARSQGVEAAVTLEPIVGLSVDANVAYTDAHFSNTTSLARPGDRLPSSARLTGQIGGEYRFALQPDWTALFGASFRYVGRRLGEFTASPTIPRFVLPSYETIDLRTGFEHDGFELNIYLRNVADKRGYTGAFGFGPYATVGLLQPRTAGVTLAKSF
jgi:iron complex outermembrane receptor protein